MTEEQFTRLEDFIQAKIENEIQRAFGRDAINETIREIECRDALRGSLGLPTTSWGHLVEDA